MRIEAYRTPDERFEGLPGYEFAPHYTDQDGLRMASYSGEGKRACTLELSTNSCASPPEWRSITQSMWGRSISSTKWAMLWAGPEPFGRP